MAQSFNGIFIRPYVLCSFLLFTLMFSGTIYAGWGDWENLGGQIKEQPNCISRESDRIDCFARGASDNMHHKAWEPVQSSNGQFSPQ